MRAFHPLFLLLNSCTCLVMGRLPYVRSSGYYTPFPPKDDRAIYEFAPLDTTEFASKSRATRDLAWREFDSFLNGDEEPNCADLRRMWRLARQLQQKAIDSNEIPQEMHPFESAFTKDQRRTPVVDSAQSGNSPGSCQQGQTPLLNDTSFVLQQQPRKEGSFRPRRSKRPTNSLIGRVRRSKTEIPCIV